MLPPQRKTEKGKETKGETHLSVVLFFASVMHSLPLPCSSRSRSEFIDYLLTDLNPEVPYVDVRPFFFSAESVGDVEFFMP